MEECIFCQIINGKLPSIKVYENEYVFVFAPLRETILSKGHVIIVPKKHYENFYDIDENYLCEIIKCIQFIGRKIKEKLGVDGLNILHASGKSAQQSVFHFHIHLVPRYKNDGLDTWPNTGYKEKDYLNCYKKIKKALN
jgi:histidine triad (HIT) family protein